MDHYEYGSASCKVAAFVSLYPAPMTDAQLLQQYVRVRVTPARIMIEVQIPGVPNDKGEAASPRWSLAATLPKLSLATAVERARQMTVADRRYFRTCDDCREKLPANWITTMPDNSELCGDCQKDGLDP